MMGFLLDCRTPIMKMRPVTERQDLPFLSGGGRMAALIAGFDWTPTALGPIEGWPQSVKTTISLILRSPVPIVTLWYEDGVMIYNDAYAEFAGARHPAILGSKVREGWPEVADFNDNIMRVCLAGGTLAYKDQELTLFRRGRPLQAALNLDYSPVLGEEGKPIGVMAIVVETTEKVRAERWLKNEQERLRQMFEQAPGFIAMLHGREHVYRFANPAYMQLVGHREILDKSVREALPELVEQGFYELLEEVFQHGKPFSGTAMPVTLQSVPGGPAEVKFVDFVYQPVVDPDGRIIGIFVQGSDVTDRVMAERAVQATARQSRQILDSAIDYAIIALGLNGHILSWNEGAHRIFGWTEEEVQGRHWDMLFTDEDRKEGKAQEAMDAAMAFGTAHHERWHVRKSGDRFWANGEINPLRDGEGRPVGLVKVLRDRTDEYLANEALAEAEARLRRAQEVGGVGVFSLDLRTNMLNPTPEFCKIYGIPDTDTMPVAVIETLIAEQDRDVASNAGSRADASSPLSVEYTIRRADTGEERVIARRGEFERDRTGQPVRFVGVVQDVTERRRAQKELYESEARFRALAQALPNHVWTAGPDGRIDWFNEGVYRYTGLARGELTGDNWMRIVHPDDRDATAVLWRQALASGETYEAEYRLCDRDGVFRWYIARAVPIRDDNGVILRWVGTNTDVDELRMIREKLEALNATLEQRVAERTADRDRMWRLSTDVMLVIDFATRITAVNPAWNLVLGWGEDDLIGRSVMDLVHPEDRDAAAREVARLAEGATTFSFENRVRRKDGSYRRISWMAVPSEDFIHAVGRDVTEEREAAASLRKTELALQQAQKMEAIGNLTGGVAHDFNNLLQVISGNLQLLAKDIAGDEKAARRVANALAGVGKGAKLAAQLLAFGRRQALDPRVLNVGRLITGMDEMLRRTIGEGVEVETMVSGGLWNTLVDPVQIENSLLNLAINARDAMDGFGKLTIEVGNAFIDDNYARMNEDVEPGQYVALSVTDTGSGIPPEMLAKVFDPFFTTKPEGRGTGLGLSMVYGFVKQSGGHVKIYSEVGHGTTVKIYLPRSRRQEDVAVDTLDAPVIGGRETILVAEDDEGVRSTVVDMLRELGYNVLKAPDAASALTIIESGITIDLLFTDVIMPGSLKSADLARQAKERLPAIAVLFTSGYTENSIVHGGRLDPGVQLLSKPYTREQLARKIRHVLANEAQAMQAKKTAEAARPVPEVMHEPGPQKPQSLRILLVEDQPLIRMDTADMLTELGHACVEAGNGAEALAALDGGAFDVAMIDMGLPDMTGDVLAGRVVERFAGLPIVFATGEAKAPTLAVGRSFYLPKPYGLNELKAVLARVAEAC